jgi:dimethylhistidine N-methyltransferase
VIHPHQYVAVDISVNHLTDAVNRLQQRFPFIEMMALEKDLSHPWDLPPDVRREQRLFFYPGSSIGNFQEDDARTFLKRCRALCDNDGGILIGIDLIKDPTILHEAYNDSLGVTAAFNLNALRHINSLIAADFDVRQWQHEAFFNVDQSRIEMHLQARTDLDVRWKTYHRHFQCGERIHTESSYKYHLPTFLKLLAQSGFEQVRVWTDENAWYAMIYAKAAQ